jgi:hypothetical protein
VRVACVLRHSNELNECSIERPLFRLRVWVCFVCLGGVDLDIKLGLITPQNTQNTQNSTTCCKFACYMWEGYRRHTGPELHTCKFGPFRER